MIAMVMATSRMVPLMRMTLASGRWGTRCLASGTQSRFLSCYSLNHSNSGVWMDQFGCPTSRILLHGSLFQVRHQSLAGNQFVRRSSKNVDDKNHSEKRSGADKAEAAEGADDMEQFQKLSLYGKIKAMYRDYWYVLVPVHLSSSLVFFGVFYYAASSGVDIIAILETLHFSETVISTLRDSSAGYLAIAYALYKICTPVRYTVTLGGTTWAIKFLKARGLIKPRRPMKEAKENVQNIISAMKLPEKERQKFLEEKGMPRIGKAVSNLSKKSDKEK